MTTPTNCQHCNQPFPRDGDDRPAYKTLPVLREGLPPITRYLCPSCWRNAFAPRPTQPAPRHKAAA